MKRTLSGTLAGLGLLLVAPAGAEDINDYGDCAFSPETGRLWVRVNDEEARVRRRGERIVVLVPGTEGLEEIDCGGQPTIHNTDLIDYNVLGIGYTEGRLSLAGGPFEPGRTAEPGVPEIEIRISLRRGNNSYGIVDGTRGRDHFVGGRLAAGRGINLNPDREGAGADADLIIGRARGYAALLLRMKGGNDVVQMNGGRGFRGPLGLRNLGVLLGPGADRFRGSRGRIWLIDGGRGPDRISTGTGRDVAYGRLGNDRISTGARGDLVDPGPGRDQVWTGPGADVLLAVDRRRDVIRCGPGVDRGFADSFDVLIGCERVRRVGRR